MKVPKPLDLHTVVRTFQMIPELTGAGAFAGANALYLEHLDNPYGRFSLDIDLQTVPRVIAVAELLVLRGTAERPAVISGAQC